MTVSDVLCGADAASCRCALPVSHDGNHECRCGGQWIGSDAAGDMRPTKLPVIGSALDDDTVALLDMMFGDPRPSRLRDG